MRYSFLLLFLLLGLAPLAAQVGVSSFVNFNTYRESGVASDVDVTPDNFTGGEVALNYWFRLPKRRIEFQPTVYYASGLESSSADEFGFQFKTNVYLFDLGTDCDCPTFGKQGPQLQKGFFLQLSPGVASYNRGVDDERTSSFSLGAGVGIDFGLSNLVTLTPIASLRYLTASAVDVTYTDDNGNLVGTSESRTMTYQLGLQATFRFDKKRY